MDDLLKDKFLSFEVDIPMTDWFAIEEKLDRKRRYIWMWWAALPLLIVSGLSLYSLLNTSNNKDLTQKSAPAKSIIKTENPADPEANTSKHQQPIGKRNTSKYTYLAGKEYTISAKTEENSTSQLAFDNILLQSKQILYFWENPTPIVERIEGVIPIPKKHSKKSKLSFELGLNFAPSLGLDAISNNKSAFLNRSYLQNIAKSSSLGSGFNNGIHAQLNIGKKWFIRSGIYSSTYSVYHNYDFIITEAPNVTIGQGITYYIPLNPVDYRHIKQNGGTSLTYISIPLSIGNRIGFTKHWGLESKIGLSLSNLQKSGGQIINPTYLNLEDINSNNSIKKWNKGLAISSGVYYKTNNNLIFTVEPNYSTQLGSAQVKDYPVKTRFYNYGVNININYILGGKQK